MAIKPPFTDIDIPKAPHGFYEGYSLPIALISKISMVLLVLWALVWPLSASDTLARVNATLLNSFNTFYIIAVGFFAFFLLVSGRSAANGQKSAWPGRGEARVFQFLMVLDDVWRRSGCWPDGLCHG